MYFKCTWKWLQKKKKKSEKAVVLHNNNLTSRVILIFLYLKRCRIVRSQSEETGGIKTGDGAQICGGSEETVWRLFLLMINEIMLYISVKLVSFLSHRMEKIKSKQKNAPHEQDPSSAVHPESSHFPKRNGSLFWSDILILFSCEWIHVSVWTIN